MSHTPGICGNHTAECLAQWPVGGREMKMKDAGQRGKSRGNGLFASVSTLPRCANAVSADIRAVRIGDILAGASAISRHSLLTQWPPI
jgi:hypothetical protein